MGRLVDVRGIDHRNYFQDPSQISSSRSRSRCRENPRRSAVGGDGGILRRAITSSDLDRGALDPVSMSARSRGKGNDQFGTEMDCSNIASDSSDGSNSPTEDVSFKHDFQRRSLRKDSGMQIKAVVDEEMSGEMEIRRPSPSVIARLMGLDASPSQLRHKQQKKTSSSRHRGSHRSYEDYSRRMSNGEQEEFKDVFEVTGSSKDEKQNKHPVWKGMPCSKQNEKDLDFIRQKFMEAKHLSTDEALQDSKELNDALEILDSNKELFLKILQETNSLSRKHHLDLQCDPTCNQASQITVLKSLKGTKYESSEICSRPERRAGKYAPMRMDSESSIKRPNSHHSFRSQHTSKTDTCLQPTRIVILKPNLEKVKEKTRNAPLLGSPENLYLGFRRQRELFRIQDFEKERKQWHRLLDNVEAIRHKKKGSREIAREVTKHIRQSIISTTKEVTIPGFVRQTREEGSCTVSGQPGLSKFEEYQQTSGCIDDWKRNLYSPSSYSSESFMSREARKRLSDRWKMTHQPREVELTGRGSNTLGEMLANSDTETTFIPFSSVNVSKISNEKSLREEVGGVHGYPSSISSRDGWKDGCFINLPRPASISQRTLKPRSRSVERRGDQYMLKDVLNFRPNDSLYGYPNQRNFSSKSFRCGEEENKFPVREIHVDVEETQKIILETNNFIREKNISEMGPMSEIIDGAITNEDLLFENCLPPESMNTEMPLILNKEQVQQHAEVDEYSSNDHIDKLKEEPSCYRLQEDLTPQSEGVESVSPVSSKEAEKPSPISVLEPLEEEEEEKSDSKCFERISADLQELRMQLQLLKLESEDPYEEDKNEALSAEDPLLMMVEREQPFRDDEERDYSYLLDTLVDSGIDGFSQARIFNTCYSPEYPVDPSVFERLEKKYGAMAEWPRSERKLLFDMISSVLSGILAPSMDLHPWVKTTRGIGPTWAHQGLPEEVWQVVVGQRKELGRGNPEEKVLDPLWLESGDHIDTIGREIERMLKEELLEEIASEYLFGCSSTR